MKRALERVAFWLCPPVLLFLTYRPGLGAWFQADDFAWLSLLHQVRDWPSFLHVMFAPMAQGTIRPWSERGFFLLFYWLFGVDALPLRIFVFLNAWVCLVLLALIARRVLDEGPKNSRVSQWAAIAAPLAWIVSFGLPVPMSWSSDYNEIQCASFLLGAFYLRLRRVYWAEFFVFVLGFGALELNIVYPALAIAWILLNRASRRDLLRAIPLVLVSIAYFVIHTLAAPGAASGPYAMHFDPAVLATLWVYWKWAMLSPLWTQLGHSAGAGSALIFLFTAFLIFAVVCNRKAALFGFAWFFLTLAPLLPLRDHVSDYYLAVPALGLALVFAAGVAAARSLPVQVAAAAVVVLYLAVNAPLDRVTSKWWADRSKRVRTLVLGTVTAHERNPGQAILLDGVDEELYNVAIADSPFAALEVPQVFLSPESLSQLSPPVYMAPVRNYALPPGPTLHALAEDQIEVYRIENGKMRNVTSSYARSAPARLEEKPPEEVDVGNPLMAYLLGPEWRPVEGDHRWMPGHATVRLTCPLLSGDSSSRVQLVLSGYAPGAVLRAGPLALTAKIDGNPLPPTKIDKPDEKFVRIFDVPTAARGNSTVVVRVEVDRVQTGPGGLERGLVFGVIGFRTEIGSRASGK